MPMLRRIFREEVMSLSLRASLARHNELKNDDDSQLSKLDRDEYLMEIFRGARQEFSNGQLFCW